MPRSYSFDPDTVSTADTDRDLARRDKQEIAAQSAVPQGETDIHYGKKFAETEAILKARAEERAAAEAEQHEAADAPDVHLGSTEEQVTATPAPPGTGAVASEVGMPGMAREVQHSKRRQRRRERSVDRDATPPLGAMPSEELPPAAEQVLAETPAELIGAFRDQVTRSVRGVGDAARQLRSAGREVAGLPLEALRLALRVGRSWLGRSPRRA
ncbi:MAG: hypothetical protein EHM78_26505 [Myxococcaceae bacterium]|nr:MAG: hypothetical protein EHM78_26505 [Myxococcaceae bacterium]